MFVYTETEWTYQVEDFPCYEVKINLHLVRDALSIGAFACCIGRDYCMMMINKTYPYDADEGAAVSEVLAEAEKYWVEHSVDIEKFFEEDYDDEEDYAR